MIITDIANLLAKNMTPVQDQIRIFDNMNTGFIYKADFTASLLENYLFLGSVLTENKKKILTQRYAPSESSLNIEYRYFIQDLQRIEQNMQGRIKICMTAIEVMKQKQDTELQAQRDREQADLE